MKLENNTIFISGPNRGIAKAIVDVLHKQGVKKIYAAGLIAGQEDIFPDPMSQQIGALWAKDPKP